MHTVELYRKVRLACRDGMSERAAARDFPREREEDAVLFGTAGLSADGSGSAPEAGRVQRDHRSVAEGGSEAAAQAAPHGQAYLREGLCARTSPPAAGDVRAADPSTGPWAGARTSSPWARTAPARPMSPWGSDWPPARGASLHRLHHGRHARARVDGSSRRAPPPTAPEADGRRHAADHRRVGLRAAEQDRAELLFELISQRYERGAFATNMASRAKRPS